MVLTGYAATDGTPVADYVEYRATVEGTPNGSKRAAVVLEPTAIRGNLTITAGGKKSTLKIADADTRVTEVDISGALTNGSAHVLFRFDRPMSLDGIKIAPTVRAE
jgi:hypothetical protein